MDAYHVYLALLSKFKLAYNFFHQK